MSTKRASDFAPWLSSGITRRGLRRWSVRLDGTFHTSGGSFPCQAHDLSPGGARIEIIGRTRVKVGSKTKLELPRYGRIPAEVRHISGRTLGLMFTHDDDHAVALATYLITKPPPRPMLRRQVEIEAVLLVRERRTSCVVEDISRYGAKVRVKNAGDFAEGQELLLRIEGHGSLPAIIRRVGAAEIGLVLVEAFLGELKPGMRPSA